ncbi:hypothetical protein L345_16740, partial [Ophiophagus hannah]
MKGRLLTSVSPPRETAGQVLAFWGLWSCRTCSPQSQPHCRLDLWMPYGDMGMGDVTSQEAGLGVKPSMAVEPVCSTKLRDTYGNVFTFWIGHTPVIVLTGFRAMKNGLIDNSEAMCQRPMFPFSKILGGGK